MAMCGGLRVQSGPAGSFPSDTVLRCQVSRWSLFQVRLKRLKTLLSGRQARKTASSEPECSMARSRQSFCHRAFRRMHRWQSMQGLRCLKRWRSHGLRADDRTQNAMQIAAFVLCTAAPLRAGATATARNSWPPVRTKRRRSPRLGSAREEDVQDHSACDSV